MTNQHPESKVFTLKNKNGLEMTVTNFGGRIITFKVPDKNGKLEDIVLGHDTPGDYINGGHPHFGALIGRYANRISKGKLSIGGKNYNLPINNDPNHLHGGVGFSHRFWKLTPAEVKGESALLLEYSSPDGEDGYPGNLEVKVTFILSNDNDWTVEYLATTDQATVVNLTQHNFYNLAGEGNPTILNHQLLINADHITPVDESLIPTGELRNVEGTPFDFRKLTVIGDRIDHADQQLSFGKGYDHNWVLNKRRDILSYAASAIDPVSKRRMDIWTTEPGIQLYTGNWLDSTDKGKNGKTYPHRSGFCLETQHYPNSPNQPSFPSTLLRPAEWYQTTTVHKFSVVE